MATKKTFTEDLNNPALAFLNVEKPKEEEPKKIKANVVETTTEESRKFKEEYTEAKATEDNLTKEKLIQAVKDGLISIDEFVERYPLKREAKTKRVQLVMRESLFNAAKEKIDKYNEDKEKKEKLSFNQYINDLIENDLKTTQE